MFDRLQLPSLGGATAWLNSEPLGPAELGGHVVLVDFWTLTCINWLRAAAVRPRMVTGLPGGRAGRARRPHAGVLVRARPRARTRGGHGAGDRLSRRRRQRLCDLARVREPTTGRRCTSSTPAAASATTTSARVATSSASASSSSCCASSASSCRPPWSARAWRRRLTGSTCVRPRRISATRAARTSPSGPGRAGRTPRLRASDRARRQHLGS